MIKLHEFLNVIGYRIHDKFIAERPIFGDLACEVTYANDTCFLNCAFDLVTQEVFEIVAEDYTNKRYYRWTQEDFRDKQDNKTTLMLTAEYCELEVAEDILAKADAIISGRDYSTKVSVPINLTDEEFLHFAKAAHELDITFNQLVEKAIKQAMAKYLPEQGDHYEA